MYSDIYWKGWSQQINAPDELRERHHEWVIDIQTISPSSFRSLSNLPCSFSRSKNLIKPRRHNPELGPTSRPFLHNSRLCLNDSGEAISSMPSTESRHGNSTGARRLKERGPGTYKCSKITFSTLYSADLHDHPQRYTPLWNWNMYQKSPVHLVSNLPDSSDRWSIFL